MKKIFSFVLLLCALSSYSQNESDKNESAWSKKNELKINALYLLFNGAEVTYERILNEESAIGISTLVSYDSDDDINYYISPYYRFYFGNKPAAGFFIEGFGMLNSSKTNIDVLFLADVINVDDNVTDFALGVGIGGKFISRRNFVVELNLGLGRNLFNTDEGRYEFVGKVGIHAGFRF
ncbi:DUF3575 domain-containing protein [Leptobacterium flavescens]|uniref:DUF3575 domain-containing protein n=1 Tax=Leptobacterium flavescens TaxID=472055 RepID=A0A6P0URR4_9FLAO|nr:DUF3575 domain-containing protein [Leptobacterium flavescens]NER14479.1 DUF3575 domain-containing protein [Leptobacterium flavescens]